MVKDADGITSAGISEANANTSVPQREIASSVLSLAFVLKSAYTFFMSVPAAIICVAMVAAIIMVAMAKIMPAKIGLDNSRTTHANAVLPLSSDALLTWYAIMPIIPVIMQMGAPMTYPTRHPPRAAL
ncbi:hypothetical protein SDC9_191358 [bioreactor metagenome]|uniref:Uncharacterized protein n=1 Tax=bioreactor metagenome TaxID=1076179 RepID=A0A645HXS3_9ZZZZ